MKKILLILCLFPILVFSQKSYKIPADSTILNNIGSGKNELVIRNATSNITGGILTNLGNGVTAFVLGGGSARVVDTIYKNNTKDSIVFAISGIRYAVKDSIGVTDLSGYALQISLNDTANTLRRIRKVDSSYLFKNATRDSICMVTVINGNTYRTCAFDSSNVNTDSQSLQLFFTDSILLGITRGNSIKFAYAVDSVGLNAGGDSIVVIKAGLRLAYKIGSSGGGSLSSLTSATATNIINNGNFKQEWQWNTHVSGSALKLSSALNTAHTPVTGSAVLDVSLSNGYIPSFSGVNYAAKFVNTYYATGSTNTAIAGYFETGDPSGILNSAVYSKGNIRIAPSSGRLYFGNYTKISGGDGDLRFSPASGFPRDNGSYFYGMEAGYYMNVIRNLSSQPYYNWQTSYLYKDISTSRQVIAFGVDGDLRTTVGVGTSYGWIERSADKLMFAAQAGLSSSSAITPNYLLTLYGTNSNVGIGTTTPVASAKLEVSSTTSGFLPPRMTATQASAISSPAQGLMLFVTDTNGTFTSVGWWGYNGSTWEKLNN